MNAKLIAVALLIALPGFAQAQERRTPAPGLLCPDGSDPLITGMGCAPIQQRNAIDEGRASSTLPQETPPIVVPNDPLGNSVGSSNLGPSPGASPGGFGNPAIQLPNIR